jgi:hypothetical protein
VATVEKIIDFEDSVYKIQTDILDLQATLLREELNPWAIIRRPTYKEFFGEENPLVNIK